MTAEVVGGDAGAQWVARHLGPLAGVGSDSMPAGSDQSEVFAAWRQFFEALAEARPLVLVFEDLHWADDGLLDFVDHLAGWAGQVPLLVAGTRQIVHQLGLYIACGEPQRTWQWTARPV